MEGESEEQSLQREGSAGRQARREDLSSAHTDSDSERKIQADEYSTEKSKQEREEDWKTLEDGKTQEGPNSSRPDSTSSSTRVKSSASGEITFEAKKKKKKRGGSAAEDDAYVVTFTVSIAIAIPTGKTLITCVCL
jgi:hypothetical protein